MNMFTYVGTCVLGALVCFAFTIPWLAFGWWTAKRRNYTQTDLTPLRAIILFLVFFILEALVLSLPSIFTIIRIGNKWNWTGKVLEILLFFILVALFGQKKYRKYGATLKISGRAWLACTPLITLPVVIHLLNIFNSNFESGPFPAWETVFFCLTMPGLGEELMFRGLQQTTLNRSFGRPRQILGAPMGWGSLAVASIFCWAHVVDVNPDFSIHLSGVPPIAMIVAIIGRLIISWLRERADSVVPGVLMHNLDGTIGHLSPWLVTFIR